MLLLQCYCVTWIKMVNVACVACVAIAVFLCNTDENGVSVAKAMFLL